MIVTCARNMKDLRGDNRRPGLVSCQGKRLEKQKRDMWVNIWGGGIKTGEGAGSGSNPCKGSWHIRRICGKKVKLVIRIKNHTSESDTVKGREGDEVSQSWLTQGPVGHVNNFFMLKAIRTSEHILTWKDLKPGSNNQIYIFKDHSGYCTEDKWGERERSRSPGRGCLGLVVRTPRVHGGMQVRTTTPRALVRQPRHRKDQSGGCMCPGEMSEGSENKSRWTQDLFWR